MEQNSSLKKEAGIAERKLLARNERIQNLEPLLQDADRRLAIQNQKFEVQLQAVRERLDQARGKLIDLINNYFLIDYLLLQPKKRQVRCRQGLDGLQSLCAVGVGVSTWHRRPIMEEEGYLRVHCRVFRAKKAGELLYYVICFLFFF